MTIPATWDDLVWDDICSWLHNDALVEQQLTSWQNQEDNSEKSVRLVQFRISRARARIAKVQEGFEGGIYSLDEAKEQIARHQRTTAAGEKEVQRLRDSRKTLIPVSTSPEVIRKKLEALRDENLSEATFEERLDIISRLHITVYPSEDLRSMKVHCELNLEQLQDDYRNHRIANGNTNNGKTDGECESTPECGIVPFGGAGVSIGRTFSTTFAVVK